MRDSGSGELSVFFFLFFSFLLIRDNSTEFEEVRINVIIVPWHVGSDI